MIVRLCKISLVASIALFFILVAYGNIKDYETNWVFVKHVLAMDTILSDSPLKGRAITDPGLVRLAYLSIIAWEALTAAILIVGTARLVLSCRDPRVFARAKPLAILGLTFGLLLFGLGFTIIGGEYFAMWQSRTWSGLDSATRFVLLDGVVLVVLIAPEV